MIIHVVLDLDGTVLAHFLRSEDAHEFSGHGVKYTHMPFNLANRDGEPAPLVGTKYRA